MKKKDIKIITLSGCNLCRKLITELGYRGVTYSILSAEVNDELCDQVEVLLGTNKYPIVIVNNNHYYHLVEDSQKLGVRTLEDGSIATGCAYVDTLVDFLLHT
jgi:hypothetical protein